MIIAFSSEVDAGSREENASKQESSADYSVQSRFLMPALRPTMIPNQKRMLPSGSLQFGCTRSGKHP
jgi:hypothetical protein